MLEVTPIIIRLELQRNAPYIKFEFEDRSGARAKRSSELKKMSSKKKNKKAAPRTDVGNDALPPVAASVTPSGAKGNPTQEECFGRRKYADVVVQTFAGDDVVAAARNIGTSSEPPQGCSIQPAASGSSLSSKAGSEPLDLEKLSYFSGNPFVEKTSGLLHFYKHSESSQVQNEDSSVVCLLGVPSLITCRELLKFVSPCASTITAMKVVRDMTPNQYMVIICFKTHENAVQFYKEYNGTPFNSIEPDKCSMVFVERMETVREEAGASLPVESLTELPNCAVCLERMDDGVVTILCNHTFHAQCLEQWADTTCPVCRHSQTPELTPDQKCFDCGKTTDLWICLICGNIGCGRYAEAHAYRHFEATSHTFTLQIGGERVWDYAGDNYVHRLIQSSTDGKMVEYQRNPANPDEATSDEKMEAVQLEYTCLLTSQLENQRAFFESKLREAEMRFEKFEKLASSQVEELEVRMKQVMEECDGVKKELAASLQGRQTVEKKLQNCQNKLNKALAELSEERTVNKLLRVDQEKWAGKVAELEQKNLAMQIQYSDTISELNEQIRDLMMHFEAQNKFHESVKTEEVSEQELQESTVVVGESPNKHRRRKK